MTPAGGGQRGELFGIDDRTWSGQRNGRLLEGRSPLTQPGREDLVELGQRADGSLGQSSHRVARRAAQAHHDRDGLVVVQQKRRQRAAWPEPISARDAGHRVHRVVKVAQPLHVAAQRPHRDAQPLGQFGPRPLRANLQQPEQPQQPGRGVQHAHQYLCY